MISQDEISGMVCRIIGKQVDKVIIEKIWHDIVHAEPYYHVKTFKKRKTNEVRHIIQVNDEVWEWLITEQNCFGQKNPAWTISGGNINISDELYTLLILKFNK